MPIDDIKSSLRRRRETALILIDQTPIDVLADADRRLAAALADDESLGTSPEVDALRAEVDAATAALEAKQVAFTFEGVGRQQWAKLLGDYPLTDDERALGLEVGTAFTVHAIATTCVSHELTPDDAEWLWENLDEAEWTKLWQACLIANYGQMIRPKSVAASALRLTSAPSWLTALHEASLAPSS